MGRFASEDRYTVNVTVHVDHVDGSVCIGKYIGLRKE